MTDQEGLTVALCAAGSDSVEARYVWEELTVAFPEHDWRSAFKMAAIAKKLGWAEEVEQWESPCRGEDLLLRKLRTRISELEAQVANLRTPISSWPT